MKQAARKSGEFLYCDNYRTCNGISVLLDTDHETYERARARGWHVWQGETMGGTIRQVILCHRCAGNIAPVKATVLKDQLPLDLGME